MPAQSDEYVALACSHLVRYPVESLFVALLAAFVLVGGASAEQTPPASSTGGAPQAGIDHQGQQESNTGRVDTQFGGASAASPQGDTPPGMQPVPAESNSTTKK